MVYLQAEYVSEKADQITKIIEEIPGNRKHPTDFLKPWELIGTLSFVNLVFYKMPILPILMFRIVP